MDDVIVHKATNYHISNIPAVKTSAYFTRLADHLRTRHKG